MCWEYKEIKQQPETVWFETASSRLPESLFTATAHSVWRKQVCQMNFGIVNILLMSTICRTSYLQKHSQGQ